MVHCISRAVKYLHSCRPTIVHRDLKPENVMLTALDLSASEGKVLDLGLHMRKAARHTLPGEVEGSFYGGNAYDAVTFNGSVTAGRIGARARACAPCFAAMPMRALTWCPHAFVPACALSACIFRQDCDKSGSCILTACGQARTYIAGKTLAEKVKAVESTEVDATTTVSPPRTNTKHNSTAAGNALKPIEEEDNENVNASRMSMSEDRRSTPEPVRILQHCRHFCFLGTVPTRRRVFSAVAAPVIDSAARGSA